MVVSARGLPDLGILQSAEVIQGESFPNLHSIRGSRYRDPQAWFKSIDKNLRPLPADFMIPSHGRPLAGRAEVAKVLTDNRDAISYVYDQTLRHINKGLLPDDLVEKVILPEALSTSEWLGDFYGGVPHSVRQIYYGELGWFNADPTTLAPLNIRESSRRYIELIGGRDAVLREAQAAADAGDHQWAAELVSHLVRTDTSDQAARTLKADALRALGYRTPNSNWRNFYLTAARELDGTIDYSLAIQINAPDQIAAMPGSALLESLRFRVDPEKSSDARERRRAPSRSPSAVSTRLKRFSRTSTLAATNESPSQTGDRFARSARDAPSAPRPSSHPRIASASRCPGCPVDD